MGHLERSLTELQFRILDGMADDYEDVEQLYLHANRDGEERYPRQVVMDEVANMLRGGFIVAKQSNNEQLAPLHPLNLSALQYYWFWPTDKGAQSWKTYSATRG